jgi:hypothetical protein
VPDVGDTLVREGETWNVALIAESMDDHRVVIMALPPRWRGILATEDLGAMAAMGVAHAAG